MQLFCAKTCAKKSNRPVKIAGFSFARTTVLEITTVLLDRLAHHCHIVENGNESYRFQHSSRAAKMRMSERARRTKRH